MAKRGPKPWITPPSKDGGKSLQEMLEKIRGVAQYTDTEREIYHALGINHDSWYKYKHLYPEITEAIDAAWNMTLLKIKRSLLKKAIDGDFQAQKLAVERKGGWKEETSVNHKGIPPSSAPVIIRLNLPEKNERQS